MSYKELAVLEQIVGGVEFEYLTWANRGETKLRTYSFDQYKIVNICRLIDKLFGNNWANHPSYEETGKAVMRWCKENKASYYAAPREDFYLGRACEQAKSEGNSVVVVEDLS